MLKQPVSVVTFTNVAIVRLKINKLRFEIACYKNKVQQYRSKVETNVNEVLQIDKIFRDAIKGDLVKKEEFNSTFPNMTYEDVVKLILDKGEIQISEKERNLSFQNVKNDIANIIVEKTFNTETGLPFPQQVIIQVLDDINYNVKESEDAKKQALKAIKLIQEKNVLPIERKLMQITFTFRNPKLFIESEKEFNEFLTKFLEFLKSTNSQIIESNLDSAKGFKVKCNILPNHYREILTNYEEILSIEIISNTQMGTNVNTDLFVSKTKSNYERLKEKSEDVPVETFANLKISNMKIDKFLEDNEDPEEKKLKKKKAMTCTKCKGSSFYEQDELRKHFKTNWHNFNAKLSSKEDTESLTIDEYDEYVLMHPESLK